MKYYVIFNGRGWLTVDNDGLIVCGEAYGTRLPYWDSAQEFAAYYQVEAVFTSRAEAIEHHKKLLFSFAASQNRAMRRRVRHDEVRRKRA